MKRVIKVEKSTIKIIKYVSMCLIMAVMMIGGIFSVPAMANDMTLSLGYLQSGQISWDGYTSYKFTLDNHASLAIDFDCNYTEWGARSPKIIIVSESSYNDWMIGKNVSKNYYAEAQTGKDYDFWCDDVVSLNSGDYRIIIDNSQGWGYYNTSYTLLVTQTVTKPVIVSTVHSIDSIIINMQGHMDTQGYNIQKQINGKYIDIDLKNVSMSQISVANSGFDQIYNFRIRGYNYCNGNIYYSDWVNIIANTRHNYDSGILTKAATCTEKGRKVYTCKECGYAYTKEISALGHKMSNGVCRRCGKSDGTEQKTTTLSKHKSGKKLIKITWKKVSGVTGYQIQYATKRNFSNAKKKTVKKSSTTKLTIKKLKAKKKYYVRIRTYKKVSRKKSYSDWSKAKGIRTK